MHKAPTESSAAVSTSRSCTRHRAHDMQTPLCVYYTSHPVAKGTCLALTHGRGNLLASGLLRLERRRRGVQQRIVAGLEPPVDAPHLHDTAHK